MKGNENFLIKTQRGAETRELSPETVDFINRISFFIKKKGEKAIMDFIDQRYDVSPDRVREWLYEKRDLISAFRIKIMLALKDPEIDKLPDVKNIPLAVPKIETTQTSQSDKAQGKRGKQLRRKKKKDEEIKKRKLTAAELRKQENERMLADLRKKLGEHGLGGDK